MVPTREQVLLALDSAFRDLDMANAIMDNAADNSAQFFRGKRQAKAARTRVAIFRSKLKEYV